MRVFVTGGTGVLGRALLPLLAAAGRPRARRRRASSSRPRSRAAARVYVQPAVAFVYPEDGLVDEEPPVRPRR